MPYTSYTEIPNAADFQSMPESAKRLAVSIMNVLEEKGLIGEAAGKQTLSIVQSIVGNQPMNAEIPKTAMDLSGTQTFANIAGMFHPVARKGANIINTVVTGKDVINAGIEGARGVKSSKGNPLIPAA